MKRKPKERIVFDEDPYYGDEGEQMAVGEIAEREGLTEREVREDYTDSEIFRRAMELKELDFGEEMEALTAFFDGRTSQMSDALNPYGGNHILVRGTSSRFDGTYSGINVYEDFTRATDCSPNHFHLGNVFADCEIQKIWDENGALFLSGAHHDGGVTVEVRQLTDEGEALLGELVDGAYLPEGGLSLAGKVYLGGEENAFIHALFENPALCQTPRYMEQAFGFKKEEWGETVRSNAKKDIARNLYAGKWRVRLILPGEHYGLGDAVTYDKEEADKYGMGLPLVEFYDCSQNPATFPGGQFTGGRYYLTTLMGLDPLGTPLSEKTALALNGDVPEWTVAGEDFMRVAGWLTEQYQVLAGDMLENVQDWYMAAFPDDELGADIRTGLTFADIWVGLQRPRDIYETIGTHDSTIRERIFTGMAERIGCSYNTVYNNWLGREQSRAAVRDAREGDYSLSGESKDMQRSESGLAETCASMDAGKEKDTGNPFQEGNR